MLHCADVQNKKLVVKKLWTAKEVTAGKISPLTDLTRVVGVLVLFVFVDSIHTEYLYLEGIPQGSLNPTLMWMARMGTKPMTLELLAPQYNQNNCKLPEFRPLVGRAEKAACCFLLQFYRWHMVGVGMTLTLHDHMLGFYKKIITMLYTFIPRNNSSFHLHFIEKWDETLLPILKLWKI